MTEYEVNRVLLSKYITSRYSIYKVVPVNLMSKNKSRIDFALFDKEKQCDVSEYFVHQFLCKVFSIDIGTVKRVINELVVQELAKLENTQVKMFYERNNS